MTTAERIYAEAKRLPDELASEVLAFILEIKQKHILRQQNTEENSDRTARTQDILQLAMAAQEHFPTVEQSVRNQEFAAMRNEWDRLS